MDELEPVEKKKDNKAKRFFRRVFVHNIGAKIFALLFSAVLWVLAVGLSKDTVKTTKPEKDGTPAVERIADL